MVRILNPREGDPCRAAVLALILGAALTACSRLPPDGGPTPAHGATLIVAQQREPASLNPALENGTSSTEWGELLFQYLVKYDDRGRLIGDAATEVPFSSAGFSEAGSRCC